MRQSVEGAGMLAPWVAGMVSSPCAMAIADASAEVPAARSTGPHVAASRLTLGVPTTDCFGDDAVAVNETLEEVGWLGVAALVAVAGRRASGGVLAAFRFLAMSFREGLSWRLAAAYRAAPGSRAGLRE